MCLQEAGAQEAIVLELGDPPTAQAAIRSFMAFDFAFELTQTRRFKDGDPLPKLLDSMRNANPTEGREVDGELWAMLEVTIPPEKERED